MGTSESANFAITEYNGARTLAIVEHLGEIFRVVRRRVNGKPWRKYVALVHEGCFVGATYRTTDPVEAAKWFKEQLSRVYADDTPAGRSAFSQKIVEFKGRQRTWCI